MDGATGELGGAVNDTPGTTSKPEIGDTTVSSEMAIVRNKMQVLGDIVEQPIVPAAALGDYPNSETTIVDDVLTAKMQLGSRQSQVGTQDQTFGVNKAHSKGGKKIRSDEMEWSENDAVDPRAIPLPTANQTDVNRYAQPGAFRLAPGLPPIPAGDFSIEDETDVVTHNETVPSRPKCALVVSAVLAEHDNNQPAPSNNPELQHAAEADPVELTVSAYRQRAYFLMTLLAIVVVASTTTGAIVATGHKTKPLAYRNINFEEFATTLLPAASLEQVTHDPNSPQGQALEWLQRETDGSTMVGWRMLQRYSLLTVYCSLNGNYWYNRTGWLSASEECSWNPDAASCDVNGRIRSLQLHHNNLTGSIPPELSLLTDLEAILLNKNSVMGTIPSVMCSLAQLTHLDLEDNLLDGTVPPELSRLTSLERFVAGKNLLNGTIPTELGLLSDLRFLGIHSNKFKGPLPTTLGLLQKIEELYVDSNSLTGSLPTQIGRMSTLKSLALDNNQFSGTLPSELGGLHRLTYANMNRNINIRGTMPSHLGLLVSLQQLYLDMTSLSGTIPSEM
jgi:hypothetical protein